MKNEAAKQASTSAIVHIIDDDDAVLDSISLLLTSIGSNNCTYSSAHAFLEAFSQEHFDKNVGCILMDVRMPIMSGIECQYKLKELGCILPIIFVTGHADVPTAVKTMKNGAFDFIQKPFREQALIDAIQKALLKNANEQLHMKRVAQTQAKLATLTERETQILGLVIDGKANKVIADELALSQRTVELHRAHVMEKMEVKSLAELVKHVLDTY